MTDMFSRQLDDDIVMAIRTRLQQLPDRGIKIVKLCNPSNAYPRKIAELDKHIIDQHTL